MSKMMFDLETMSTNPNAAIASIGAVIFDEKLGITDRFYTNVSLKSCKDVGLHFSDDTIQWWKQQKPEVMASLMVDPIPVSEAVIGLFDFYKNHKCVEVFSWGANFDFPVISSASGSDRIRRGGGLCHPEYWGSTCKRPFSVAWLSGGLVCRL